MAKNATNFKISGKPRQQKLISVSLAEYVALNILWAGEQVILSAFQTPTTSAKRNWESFNNLSVKKSQEEKIFYVTFFVFLMRGFRTSEVEFALPSSQDTQVLMYSYSHLFFESLQYNLIIKSVQMEICGANEIIGFQI